MKTKIINWLDRNFGSFPEWSDLDYLRPVLGFKTRYGYISTSSLSNVAQGEIYYDTMKSALLVNISSDPANPCWHQV